MSASDTPDLDRPPAPRVAPAGADPDPLWPDPEDWPPPWAAGSVTGSRRTPEWPGGVDASVGMGSGMLGDAESIPPRRGPAVPLLLRLTRLWLEPRPAELRGAVVLLALALAVTVGLWFDASRRPAQPLQGAFTPVLALPDAPGPGSVPFGESGAGGASAIPGELWAGTGEMRTSGELVVHVSGAVDRPGLVTLVAGQRVGDAIVAAGGAHPDARLDRLNLARQVVDGEQIHVPRVGEDAPPPAAAASRGVLPDGRIELNLASAAELETLPGIGPARAQAIIAARDERPFRVPGDLRRVPGIGEATFQRLAPLVAVT